MDMINSYCGVERDARGVMRLTISNAGSLNILNTAVINGVRQGLEQLAKEPDIRALVIAGSGEKSMLDGPGVRIGSASRANSQINERVLRGSMTSSTQNFSAERNGERNLLRRSSISSIFALGSAAASISAR